jgi:hypothetical protein
MKVVFIVETICSTSHATHVNEIDTDYPISRNTKFYVTPDVALYPKEVTVSFFENKVYVKFLKKFWWWQEEKHTKFCMELYDVPKIA